MSLQNYMACLTREQLLTLHSDLIDASLAFDLKGDYKAIFANRRNEASGKRKKIYAGLAKAKRADINNMIEVLVNLLPNGIVKNEQCSGKI